MTEKALSTMANRSRKDQKNSWRNRLRLFLNPFDARFEDMQRENWLRVPHSIVVGFSIGIAATIALTQFGEVLGLKAAVSGGFLTKLQIIGENLNQANGSAMFLGLLTFVIVRVLLNVSIYIPAPLLAHGVCTLLSGTMLANSDLTLIKTKYGEIPTNFLLVTPPALPSWELAVLGDLVFYSLAFAFVCGFESLPASGAGLIMEMRLTDPPRFRACGSTPDHRPVLR